MVVANPPVDIAALKARHPLGDAVEAAGVRLRGRGRVRQGVCPFHDEAEGSFTVYADTEKFYCFGCGEAGDVLDFIRRTENLSLPEAIRRLDGSSGVVPAAAVRFRAAFKPRRSTAAVVPPRDPALLTAAGRFYAGQLRRSHAAREYLASRGIGLAAVLRLGLGYAPGSGLREFLESSGFTAGRIGDSGLFMERGSERFAGMAVVPDVAGGLSGGLRGGPSTPTPRPASSRFPAPSRFLGLGVSAPRRPGRCLAKGSSTGSPLRGGAFPPAPPWAPRAWRRSPPPCGAAPASSSPSTRTTRAGRRRSGFRPCLAAGPQPYTFPKAWATLPSLRRIPTGEPSSCACWYRRRTPPGSQPTTPRGPLVRFLTPPHRFPSTGA